MESGVFADRRESELEVFGVGDPGGVIFADEFAAAFNYFAGNEVVKGKHAATHTIAGFYNNDLVTGSTEFVGRRQSRKTGTNDHHAAAARQPARAGRDAARKQSRRRDRAGEKKIATTDPAGSAVAKAPAEARIKRLGHAPP